jgi:hypothetical protein
VSIRADQPGSGPGMVAGRLIGEELEFRYQP